MGCCFGKGTSDIYKDISGVRVPIKQVISYENTKSEYYFRPIKNLDFPDWSWSNFKRRDHF